MISLMNSSICNENYILVSENLSFKTFQQLVAHELNVQPAKKKANNFMLQICVDDIHTAYEICSKAQHKTKISDISEERWGKVFYLWGPSGELLHITELVGQGKV